MARFRGLACWVVLAASALSTRPVLGAHLQAEVIRVGFPGSAGQAGTVGADHFRVGSYTPILVELTNTEADTFTGVIEARQQDRDGDEVVARREVMVSGTRRYFLYVPAGENADRTRFSVRVLNLEGGLAKLFNRANEPVREVAPAADPVAVRNEHRVILDISERPVNTLGTLVSNQQLARPVVVIRSSPRDLPDNPVGFEMADTIVWDAADTEAMDLAQREALLEWARRGGRLIVAVSRNWQTIGRSKLGEVLPARLTNALSMTQVPKSWEEDVYTGTAPPLSTPLTYTPVTRASLLPGAAPLLPDSAEPNDPLLAVRSLCGRGEVILVTAELSDLPKHGVPLDIVLRKLVGVKRHDTPDDNEQYARVDLFRFVEQRTGFQVTTQLYLMIAFVFVVVYVFVATGGVWTWLKRRGLIQHAWGAFALVVLVASAGSLAAVQMIRGIGYRVQELTFVDGQAGSSAAAAVTYLGLKTAAHTELDLRLAAAGGPPESTAENSTSIRPLPAAPDDFQMTQYKAGQRYEAVAAVGELRGVPLRATLKQFEGVWRGELPGRIEASLQRRGTGNIRLSEGSWIRNGLDTDLDKCYLLVPSPGANWPDRRRDQMIVYSLERLGKGQRLSVADIEKAMAAAQARQAGEATPGAAKVPLFSEEQDTWFRRCGGRVSNPDYYMGMEREQQLDMTELNTALLLATTYDELNRPQSKSMARSQGQHLDRSAVLSRDSALLIGFSSQPGPVVLCWREPGDSPGKWRPLRSEEDRTVVYRIVIPIAP